MENHYFKLFACCLPIKGVARSAIYDLQRYDYEFIPNVLYEILHGCSEMTIEAIKQQYGHENATMIDEYFDFLVEKEYGFWCNKEELSIFPAIDISWDVPFDITNAIIDFDANTTHNLHQIAYDLNLLGCRAIELRFYDTFNVESISKILSYFDNSRIRTILPIIKFDNAITDSDIEFLCGKHQRIKHILIHSSPENRHIKSDRTFSRIEYSVRKFDDESCCGNVLPAYFRVNTQMYIESQFFNSCLNQKISVDRKGDIKNCPSSAISFGKINETTLRDVALYHPDFKKMWNINKDQVKVCQDCEFRYMCTDCRVFISDEKDLFSKPQKCNYNPYTATWEN